MNRSGPERGYELGDGNFRRVTHVGTRDIEVEENLWRDHAYEKTRRRIISVEVAFGVFGRDEAAWVKLCIVGEHVGPINKSWIKVDGARVKAKSEGGVSGDSVFGLIVVRVVGARILEYKNWQTNVHIKGEL